MTVKKLNRNAFNEKIIHRYLFERLYFGKADELKKLLPVKYHNYKINLITPEESKKDYRADLVIYFKEIKEGVPVEVKWNSKSSIGKNQIDFLKENNGIIYSFDSLSSNYTNISNITIDYNDFQLWISHNISKLTRESLIYQAKISSASKGHQFWIVYLRGTAHSNWDRMIKNSKNHFWAFKQNRKALKNIFDIQKGDYCLFIKGLASEGMGMSKNPSLKFEYLGWYLTKIKEPYYMALDVKKGTFFEEKELPINERRWPHFMDFDIIESCESKKRINYGKRQELADSFANSANNGGGTPVPLNNRQWESLIDKLRSQKTEN